MDNMLKCNKTLISINDNNVKNIPINSTSLLLLPAPPPNIKPTPILSCADTGSDRILLRQEDAIAATLDIQPAILPLQVRFPDGKTALSIGTTAVALPSTAVSLPAHVFDDNSLQQSLFGISDITNLDYNATFRKDGLYLYQNKDLVHYTPKAPNATSWTLPLQRPCAKANAALSLPSDKKYSQFMHASFGSPALSTLLRALRKGYLSSLPRFTSALLCKHPPNSLATAMGHLDRRRQGLDSTTPVIAVPPPPTPPTTDDSSPPETYEDDIKNISELPGSVIDNDPTIYTKLFDTADFDATGRYPVPSAGARHIYHLVSCFNGNIHVETMQSRTSAAYILAYKNTFQHWSRYGPAPEIVRLDNETSTDLEKFLLEELRVKNFQYFPTRNHRANRAERCIRTWKNHFIATLATASPKFPISYWNKLIPLAELTLNCLLPWQPNPSISAYHGLTGAPFDFRAHPIAPAGTAILIHEAPEVRGTWAGHGVPGFYIGPALSHYRSHHVHVTSTSSPRVTDTVAWFPATDVTPPPPDIKEMLIAAIKDFLCAIKKFDLKGDFPAPMLLQELEDLATLHHTAPPPVAPAPVHNIGTETRVLMLDDASVQEPRVVLPALALANPVHTAPANPLPIVALLPPPYPPPPGLPPLPVIDHPNTLLEVPISVPTVPVAPLRRSPRVHVVRTPSSFGYTAVTVPAPYIDIIRGDNDTISAANLNRAEVAELLSAAATAGFRTTDHLARAAAASAFECPLRQVMADYASASASSTCPAPTYLSYTIDHLAHANAAAPLNVNPDGSPLTFQTAIRGVDRPSWKIAEDTEVSRLLDTTTMHPIHSQQQPLDRRGDTTYYNPKPKEKYDDDMNKVYRIRGTAGGDRINYDGPTKANTAALSTVKILLQSIVSDNANFMTLDIKDFYLMTPLPRPEYLRIPLKFLSKTILDKHNLHQFIHNNSVLFEVTKSMYGLPHAGKIAQDVLVERLALHGYLQTGTTCLFRHVTNGVAFVLVVDDFGVKFKDMDGAEDLIRCLQLYYTLTIKKDATKYLGLTIAVDKITREVRLSAPGVIAKALKQFAPISTAVARSPAIYQPPRFGAAAQTPTAPDTSPLLTADQRHRLQQLGGVLLYYCLAIDSTGLPAVTAIESALAHATHLTQRAADRLLAYFRHYPDNILVLKACNMRLHTQSDASYCTRSRGRSVAGGIAYLGNEDPTEINGPIMAYSTVIQNVMASIGEAEYAAAFHTAQMAAGLRKTLSDLGYPQPPTYILVDNKVAYGIASNTIEPKRTKSIDMQFHWLRDRVQLQEFIIIWRKGMYNLADFFTKPLSVKDHQSVMHLLVRVPSSSPVLHTHRALRTQHEKTYVYN